MRNPNLDAGDEHLSNADREWERVLRPRVFDDFAGQPQIVENLHIFISAARKRGEALDHVLLHGPRAWARPRCPISSPTNWA